MLLLVLFIFFFVSSVHNDNTTDFTRNSTTNFTSTVRTITTSTLMIQSTQPSIRNLTNNSTSIIGGINVSTSISSIPLAGNSTNNFTPTVGNITTSTLLTQSTQPSIRNSTNNFTPTVGNITNSTLLTQNTPPSIGNSTNYFSPTIGNITNSTLLTQSTQTSIGNSTNQTNDSSTISSINSNTTQFVNFTIYTSIQSRTVTATVARITSTTLRPTRTRTSTTRAVTAPPTLYVYIYQVRFSGETWYNDYSNTMSALFYNECTKLQSQLMSALLPFAIVNVTIQSLMQGSVIANTTMIFTQPVTYNVISVLISGNITGATVIDPLAEFPAWLVAAIGIFGALLVVLAIYLMITIGFHRPKKKSYGRDQVEFFEMENGWKFQNSNLAFEDT